MIVKTHGIFFIFSLEKSEAGKAFEPIIVTTNDENNHAVEYNMIPSTQYER